MKAKTIERADELRRSSTINTIPLHNYIYIDLVSYDPRVTNCCTLTKSFFREGEARLCARSEERRCEKEERSIIRNVRLTAEIS